MGSDEFRTMVQKGKVEFKNGTSIICHLRTSKRMNHEGEVKITRYDVVLVNKYFDNHKPIETIEGRNKRKKAEADNLQLKFDY